MITNATMVASETELHCGRRVSSVAVVINHGLRRSKRWDMADLNQVPEWLGAAGIGAVLAAVGYVAKLIVDSWLRFRDAQSVHRARLVELRSLLQAGWTSFDVQNEHAKHLLSMIRERHTGAGGAEDGYERTFSRAFGEFGQDEKELHAIIRGITIHSLRPTNQSLSTWLRSDTYFKAQKFSKDISGELAQKLAALEAHLILWHAKYETWIPDHPEHALVYMADEERHGVGFPSGIDEVVRKALQ
jgi:hypothetical protein